MAGKRPTSPEEIVIFLLQHPLRKRLLRLYLEATEMRSPKEMTVPVNEDVSLVGWHVRVLAEHGAIELVAEEQRRGCIEHFYEATSFIDKVPWARAALGL